MAADSESRPVSAGPAGKLIPEPVTEADTLLVARYGLIEYGEALELQQRVHAARVAGLTPDLLLLLEHPPVLTRGRRSPSEHLLLPEPELKRLGVSLHEVSRGGDITYHGPGQLVGYPIIGLGFGNRDVHGYMRRIEELLIRTIREFGIVGTRAPGRTGVWVDECKVAAIGVAIRRWVTMHGFALNCSTNLEHFRWIVPCGISEGGVTSLSRLLNREVTVDEAIPPLLRAAEDLFGKEIRPISPEQLEALLAGFGCQNPASE